MCFILGILIVNYIDDLAGAECKQKAAKAYQELCILLYNCGLEESVSKACTPCTRMTFLGTLFDTEDLTLSVTPERLQEILLLVEHWLQNTHATLQVTILDRQTAICFKLCETFSRFYLPFIELVKANSGY